MRGTKGCLFALSALVLAGCGSPAGEHWKRVGSLDGDFIQFVEIDPGGVKNATIYRDAANRLCGDRQCFQIGFFAAGDRTPPSGDRGQFFSAGGWGPYAPVAIYMGRSGEFTKWDCARGPTEGAPIEALCGKGVAQNYAAVLALATRIGWTKGCGLPATNDRHIFEHFMGTRAAGPVRDQYQAAFDKMLATASDGPDDHADCKALASKIEFAAEGARATLIAAEYID